MFQELKYKFQRAFRGYDETIKWDFLGYFQQFIKPLKEFCEQELKDIHPDNKKMIEVFTKKNPDLLIAVSRCRRNPYFHLLKTNKNGFAEHVLKSKFIRRQDAPVVYDITNSCWIFSRRAILNCWRIPRKTLIHEITSFYIDIDNKEDLDYFEYYIKSHNLK